MAGENILPYKVAAPPPHARDRGAARSCSARRVPRSQFQAHLVPLDQGELASCYVTPTRALVAATSCDELLRRRLRRRAVRRGRRRAPGRARGARDELLPRSSPPPTSTPARCSCSPRSTTSGRGPPRRRSQNLNLMFGLPETRGCVSAGQRRADGRSSARAGCRRPRTCASSARDAGLPAGFRAAGVAAGLKPSGDPDLGLLVCDAERPVSAARFTATGTPAAPVLVTRERCRLRRAARGARQLRLRQRRHRRARARRRRQDAGRGGARRRRASPREVALASTGGDQPPRCPCERIAARASSPARAQLRRDGDGDFQQAIQTTDAFEKRANLEVELPSGTVRLSAQCKGAGMISPRFATMLCFVQTDAALRAADRRPAARRVRQALLRPRLASTASSRPTTPRS